MTYARTLTALGLSLLFLVIDGRTAGMHASLMRTHRTHMGEGGHQCPSEVFLPGIRQQLHPWTSGITSQHIAAASDHLYWKINNIYDQEQPEDFLTYPKTKVLSASPHETDYPWSSAKMVKVVCLNNTWYLPAGHIPVDNDQDGLTTFHRNYRYPLEELVALSKKYQLPDTVLVYSSGDFPSVQGPSENGFIPPIFHSSSERMAYDLILPDSYPKYHVMQYPYDTDWMAYIKEHSVPWEERKGAAVGRYNLMCPHNAPLDRNAKEMKCPRIELHALLNSTKNHAHILDAGLYNGVNNTLPFISMEEQLNYKYNINLDGASIAGRLPYLLASGQTVIMMADPGMQAWFTSMLEPWVHYVPFGYDNYEEIFDVIEFLNKNSAYAEQIAVTAQRFAQEYLTEAGRDCYVLTMLEQYSHLLKMHIGTLADYPHAVTLEEGLEKSQSEWERLDEWLKQNPSAKRTNN